jgi:hypothetical protein
MSEFPKFTTIPPNVEFLSSELIVVQLNTKYLAMKFAIILALT